VQIDLTQEEITAPLKLLTEDQLRISIPDGSFFMNSQDIKLAVMDKLHDALDTLRTPFSTIVHSDSATPRRPQPTRLSTRQSCP